MSANHNIIDLYHGSDHIVEFPAFGVGKPDNDYGSGFYTTRILNRASEWALLFGMKEARVNHPDSISAQELADAVVKAGYEVVGIE